MASPAFLTRRLVFDRPAPMPPVLPSFVASIGGLGPCLQCGDQRRAWRQRALAVVVLPAIALASTGGGSAEARGQWLDDQPPQPLDRPAAGGRVTGAPQNGAALLAPILGRQELESPSPGTTAVVSPGAAAGLAAPLPELQRRLQTVEQKLERNMERQTTSSPDQSAAASGKGREPITVLRGEAIFGLETLNNLERVDGEPSNGKHYYIGYRLRLNLDTSFFGEDRLRVRLQSRTLPELESITGSALTNISFDGDTLGRLEVSDLWYRFPIGKRSELNLTAIGGSLRDNVPVVNPLFYGSSRGSISVFGSEDPIIRSRSGAGIGLSTDLNKQLNLSAAAISGRAGERDYGVFGSRNSAILQLTYSPSKTFVSAVALTYSKNDSFLADQFEDSDLVFGAALSGEIFYQITDRFALGLRGGLIETSARDLPGDPRKRISSYAMTIGFPHLFGRGNLLGFVLGRPPAVIVDGLDLVADDRTAHLEAFYRYTVSDQVAITPGVMFIRTPTTSGGSENYWIGALRMTFRF